MDPCLVVSFDFKGLKEVISNIKRSNIKVADVFYKGVLEDHAENIDGLLGYMSSTILNIPSCKFSRRECF